MSEVSTERRRWSPPFAAAATAFVVCGAALRGRSVNWVQTLLTSAGDLEEFDGSVASFWAIEVSGFGGAVGRGYPWAHVAEVHARTLLSLRRRSALGSVAFLEDEAHERRSAARWRVDGVDLDASACVGGSAEHRFSRAGWHSVSARPQFARRAWVNASVLVKYVRRDVYSLEASERGRFLDALQVVYRTEGSAGRAAYGADFVSAAELVLTHLRGAAARECDRWHDDAAFVVKHVAFTLALERALQSVDDRVTVPYWDYAADAALPDWTDALVFHAEWFGEASPNTTTVAHVLSAGRWAWTRIEGPAASETRTADARGLRIANAYGLLRSPWNVNSAPFLARSRLVLGLVDGGYSLPTSSAFALARTAPSLAVLTSMLNGMLHGEVHVMLGGHWGVSGLASSSSAEEDADERANERARLTMTSGNTGVLLSSKMLWRQGLAVCPAFCAADSQASDCVCSCPSALLDEFLATTRRRSSSASSSSSSSLGHVEDDAARDDAFSDAFDRDDEARARAVLNASGVFEFNPLFSSEKWLEHSGLEGSTALLELLCEVGTPGEMCLFSFKGVRDGSRTVRSSLPKYTLERDSSKTTLLRNY